MYVIRNKNQPQTDFWSNEQGWVDLSSADLFTVQEQAQLNLPTDGEWASLWEVNAVQYARLIDEADAAGAFTIPVLDDMAESMDLDYPEVEHLIERAREDWEEWKSKVSQKSSSPNTKPQA